MLDGEAHRGGLPSMIGRNIVLGHLATGGMAEIFLGKEPAGRPIVIKRILSHLARQGTFVAMFLDEARIGSLVRHPNVVELYELGQVGLDLFIVMEYLGGESAWGLMRRLQVRRDRLPFALAAYVVAEACAGLHAAHELRDEAGTPLGLVHRDISPSNIFVTYDGDVKLLDFGIATAVDRLTRTATGQVKGKFSYMSPEQCRGLALDLRTDVFSLGVVLYELTTQLRLFKRANELLVFRAITEEPIPLPSRQIAGYPEMLERICVKALARDPARRHSSALELRNDLLAAAAALGFDAPPRTALASRMADLFPERIADKRRMLANLCTGVDVGPMPPAEVDESVEVPQVDEHSLTVAMRAPRIRGARRHGIAAAAVLSLGAAAVWWFGFRVTSPGVASSGTIPSVAASAAPSPSAATPIPDAMGITIQVESVPTGAMLVVDDKPRGQTPVALHLAAAGRIELQLDLPGYVHVAQRLAIERDQNVLIPMVAAPANPANPSKSKKPARKPADPFQRFD